ncbi:MAG: hypothetical protein ABR608_13850 [Pseudonocardiaceae bacterium]
MGRPAKRSEERLGHRTKAEQDRTSKAPAGETPAVPDPDPDWHPNAKRFYAALRTSGQSQFYEGTDWALGWHVAALMSENVTNPDSRNAAALLGQILKGTEQLLATEGARRRVHLELQRRKGESEVPGGEDSAVAAMGAYRAQLRGA